MNGEKKASIVTIADSRFVLAVFVLLCSLRKHNVKARVYVLGVNLKKTEADLLEQFGDVCLFPGDPSNVRSPSTRKGEALLLAEGDDTDYVTLLDGDCLV